ncbi:HlyD family efflux transporter periplasmic adaptor subunit [Planctomycetales bacterium ZRK34]|nr:HlyD family efflux transporter periplasmic adaptor subunit [Planctomycetales bacterium ZRK34]
MNQHVKIPGSTQMWSEQLKTFSGPPELFLRQLLSMQCSISRATQGVILRHGPKNTDILAIWPLSGPQVSPPTWFAQVSGLAPQVLDAGQARVVSLPAQDSSDDSQSTQYLLLMPLISDSLRAVTALQFDQVDSEQVDICRQRIEPLSSYLSLYEMRLALNHRNEDMQRLHHACQILGETNKHQRYKAAAMALCNQIADTWDAERVSLGWVKGRYVKVETISHSEQFTRKMELIQFIESTMEECVDQDIEVLYPVDDSASVVNRSARELAAHSSMTTVLSLPIRRDAEVVGVLTIERATDQPIAPADLQALRLTCDLCTPRLADLEQHDKWFGARLLRSSRQQLATWVGPTHTWVKLATIGTLALILLATFVHGTYRVEAPFVAETTELQIISAPFEGYLREATLRPGDRVVAGQTVLAQLDTAQLKLQRAEAMAERRGYLQKAEKARSESKISDEHIALADAERVGAQIDLLAWQISHATVHAPIDGIIVTGDLTKMIGSPVELGQHLFEVAPLDEMHAKLSVSEDLVIDLEQGQIGALAAVSHPGDYLPFEVQRIDPMAKVVEQRNVFYVQVRLLETRSWLRPGMEGLAKVDVKEAPYAWIWTRKMINWIRMKLWL